MRTDRRRSDRRIIERGGQAKRTAAVAPFIGAQRAEHVGGRDPRRDPYEHDPDRLGRRGQLAHALAATLDERETRAGGEERNVRAEALGHGAQVGVDPPDPREPAKRCPRVARTAAESFRPAAPASAATARAASSAPAAAPGSGRTATSSRVAAETRTRSARSSVANTLRSS